MRCEECLPVLEECFDGELDQTEVNAVSAHVSVCSRCAAAFDSLKSEQHIYSRYIRDVEVTPQLWESVRERTFGAASASELMGESASRLGLISTLRGLLASLRLSMTVGPRLSPLTVLLLIAIAIGATLWLSRDDGPPAKVVSESGQEQPSPISPAIPAPSPAHEPGKLEQELRAEDRTRPRKQPVRATRRPESTADQLVREAEQKYLAAIAILNRDVARRR
jgi:hypothetical protein